MCDYRTLDSVHCEHLGGGLLFTYDRSHKVDISFCKQWQIHAGKAKVIISGFGGEIKINTSFPSGMERVIICYYPKWFLCDIPKITRKGYLSPLTLGRQLLVSTESETTKVAVFSSVPEDHQAATSLLDGEHANSPRVRAARHVISEILSSNLLQSMRV